MTASNSNSRKRFYTSAAAAARNEGSFAIELDGRQVKTPAGRPLAVPTRALADAIAQEWNAQGEEIVSATLPLTRLANSAIDGVAGRQEEVVHDIVNYASTDLLCYRASSPAGLAAGQARVWNPILSWVRREYGAVFNVATGIQHVGQPAASLEAIKRAISSFDDFKLAAFHVMTSLTGSALIALAHVKGFLDADDAWRAAHVDESWQASHWGEDFEAAERQGSRKTEFLNASLFFKLA
jgi:chaperone required for assembly of F1-ATPase